MRETNFGLARDHFRFIYIIEDHLIDTSAGRYLTDFHRLGRGGIVLARLPEPGVPLPPELPYADRLGGGWRNRN
jgi:hypothetical protein